MVEKINEFFTLPTNTYLVTTFGNVKLYSSDSLKEKFIEAMKISVPTMAIGDHLENMVNKEKIVPCYLTKNLLFAFLWKTKIYSYPEDFVAYFSPKLKKVFLIMGSELMNFGFSVDEEKTMRVLLHEMMHYYSDLNAYHFFSTFKIDLIDYYKKLFELYFKIDQNDLDDEDVLTLIVYMYKNIESLEIRPNEKVINGLINEIENLTNSLTPMKEDDYRTLLEDISGALNLFLDNPSKFFWNSTKFKNVINPLYKSYESVFHIKPLSLCIQELIYPSEVIAICAEMTNKFSKYQSLFK